MKVSINQIYNEVFEMMKAIRIIGVVLNFGFLGKVPIKKPLVELRRNG